MSDFKNYEDWRMTMIKHAGLTLDQDYCKERIKVLWMINEETRTFIKHYGAASSSTSY